jgi:hypothetical protein
MTIASSISRCTIAYAQACEGHSSTERLPNMYKESYKHAVQDEWLIAGLRRAVTAGYASSARRDRY